MKVGVGARAWQIEEFLCRSCRFATVDRIPYSRRSATHLMFMLNAYIRFLYCMRQRPVDLAVHDTSGLLCVGLGRHLR